MCYVSWESSDLFYTGRVVLFVDVRFGIVLFFFFDTCVGFERVLVGKVLF